MFLQITKNFNLLLIEIDQRASGRQKNSSIQQVTDYKEFKWSVCCVRQHMTSAYKSKKDANLANFP